MKSAIFIVYLFIEILISLPIASNIGVLYTFLEIIFSVIIGFFLLLSTPFKMAEIFQNSMGRNFSISAFGISTFLRVTSAFLLILPGFFGDMIGVVLFIGSIIFRPKVDNSTIYEEPKRDRNQNEEIIDVEIIDDNNSINRK
ncbi:MAG: FxsA family protein [Campylobacteraceae bacterium]